MDSAIQGVDSTLIVLERYLRTLHDFNRSNRNNYNNCNIGLEFKNIVDTAIVGVDSTLIAYDFNLTYYAFIQHKSSIYLGGLKGGESQAAHNGTESFFSAKRSKK
ncbi:hypothetical protein BpHYR1_031783 [Brachionus plicatilis]|uniref:Uncharacterized protein n=1 Tax=Brachionus plicatilis TaxID=10195 RepID=A0A3M7RY36_BRAPC|nr:hypothetical protein BpHYR1_031783 [Brachionus plicatilis]